MPGVTGTLLSNPAGLGFSHMCIENRCFWVTLFSETFLLVPGKIFWPQKRGLPNHWSIPALLLVHPVKFTFHLVAPPRHYRLPGAVGDVNPAFFLGRVPGTQKVAWRGWSEIFHWSCQAPNSGAINTKSKKTKQNLKKKTSNSFGT